MNRAVALPYPAFEPRKLRALFVTLAVMTVITAGLAQVESLVEERTDGTTSTLAAAKAKTEAALSSMPLSFVANGGQVQDAVAFTVTGSETSLGFLRNGVAWRLSDGQDAYVVRQAFVGGSASIPVGVDPQRTRYSWFKGSPEEWVTGARAYSAVRYSNVWPGIDIVYSGDASQVKYRFVVSPGADPGAIRMAYRGATVSLANRGDLNVATPVRTFTDTAPRSYQGSAVVSSAYALHEDGTYSFNVGAYDTTEALVIDPAAIVYAGFIGGSGGEAGYGITVDASGAAYVTGYTTSTEATFPVVGGPDLTPNGGYDDAFVAKVAPSGTSLSYAGFIGGSGGEAGYGIAVDASGAAYVTGATDSTEATFPEIGGPDLTSNGGTDAFVAKVAPSGTSLSYAGFIGGSGGEAGYGIAVDASGAAYVTGHTDSIEATFPEIGGPDLTSNGGTDAFVAKVAPSGTSLSYAGYIGGSGGDDAIGISVDASGAAYVTGATASTEATFPEIGGPDLTSNGGTDAFVAKVAPSGTSLSYAGFIGGSGGEAGYGISVDASGAAYVTGYATSTEATFPEIGGPDLTWNGNADAFVAKVAPSGTSLSYAGFIGGSGYDYGYGIAVDASGAAYVTGATDSTEATFPEIGGPDLTSNGGTDAFVAKVAPSGTSLSYAGYIGGSGGDDAKGIAVDASGAAYVTGATASTGATLPVAGGPDLTHNGFVDAFVAKVREEPNTGINSGPTGTVAKDAATFSFSSDQSDSTFECRLDSGGWGDCGDGSKQYSGLADGAHAFDVRAVNSDGQKDLTPATRSWTVDTTAPQTTIDGAPGFPTQSQLIASTSASFSFSSSEAGSAFECSIDGSAWSPCLSGRTYNGLEDGLHTFFVRATDGLGHTDPTPASWVWSVDVPSYQPDGLVKLSSSDTYLGGNTYNSTGSGQTATTKAAKGAIATFDIEIENDGTATDTFAVLGTGNALGYKVTYMSGATNVTTQVVAGTYLTGALASGANVVIQATVKLSKKATGTKTLLVTSTSGAAPTAKDTVRTTVKVLK